jgi:hypothetical protein
MTDDIAGRNPDGSIDYGYYRRRASSIRSAKLRGSLQQAARYAAPIIAVAAVIALICAVTARGPRFPPQAGVASFGTAGVLPMLR